MISLSLCMIVKNEEMVIRRCLESVKDIVDEIIVVDTGSTDKTKKIVSEYTDKIYDFKWEDDFAKARNYSFSKATKDYIIWLDADDIVLEEDKIKLKTLMTDIDCDKVDAIMAPYNVGLNEEDKASHTFNRERIVLRTKNFKWVGFIHEVIAVEGNIIYSDFCVTHKKEKKSKDRNLNIFEKKIKEGHILCPREEFYYARELLQNNKSKKASTIFEKFLDDGNGSIEDSISACQNLAMCYFAMRKNNRILSALTRSFEYDMPRAEICCDIGAYFMNNNKLNQSIYWYKLAYNIPYSSKQGGFKFIDCYKFIPYIQICNCYYRLGKMDKAYEYHLKSKGIRPKNKMVLNNERYFQSMNK